MNVKDNTLDYLIGADYRASVGGYNVQTDDYYDSCKKEYPCDIRVYYDSVTLQNGTLMKSFKWRHTKPVKMWVSRFWSGKLDFHVSKPGDWESYEVMAIPRQQREYSGLDDTILAVPYGWGQVSGKWCFLNDDGSLNWTKTSDEYKNKGKRQNFGVDVKETMDGSAWQMKTPAKNGRTLRSGRVLEEGDDVINFATSQRFIATEHANDCVTLFEDAAKVAVAVAEVAVAVAVAKVAVAEVAVAEVAEVTPKKKAKVSFNSQPIVKIYTPPDRLSRDQLLTQMKEKDEYIQMLERTSELSKKVISGQQHLIEVYRKQIEGPLQSVAEADEW
jgi:hypothetical protein